MLYNFTYIFDEFRFNPKGFHLKNLKVIGKKCNLKNVIDQFYTLLKQYGIKMNL